VNKPMTIAVVMIAGTIAYEVVRHGDHTAAHIEIEIPGPSPAISHQLFSVGSGSTFGST